MKPNNQYFNVGQLVNTHGLKGEVKVLSRTDFPEERFKVGKMVYLFLDGKYDGLPLTIESSRVAKGTHLLRFVNHASINEVEQYKGSLLKVPATDQITLSEDEYYIHEILGCEVHTDKDEFLGMITDVLSPGANDVWVVKMPDSKKEILLPVIQEVVLSVDIQSKRILVHVLEGLI